MRLVADARAIDAPPPGVEVTRVRVDAPEIADESDAPDLVAWDELMRRHERRVVVSLVARGIPLERAQELSQDAWLRIISQHRAGRLPRLEMPGIVIAQATFLARDEHRRRDRRTSMEGPDGQVAAMADAVTGPDLERRVAARHQLRRVAEVVGRRHASARTVFELLYGSEPHTPAEVAEKTGLSLQRVRQILCEIRKAIRQELRGGDDVRPT